MDEISTWETGDHVLKGLGWNPAEDAITGLDLDLLGNWPHNEVGWPHDQVGGRISNHSPLQYQQTQNSENTGMIFLYYYYS
jgi:hypothetical protein